MKNINTLVFINSLSPLELHPHASVITRSSFSVSKAKAKRRTCGHWARGGNCEELWQLWDLWAKLMSGCQWMMI